MDFSWRFDGWYTALPKSDRDSGSVVLVVVRPPSEEPGPRETPQSIRMTPEDGIEGDKWTVSESRNPGSQISLMNVHVLRSLAGSDDRMKLSGDNFIVDLELSKENLPTGTRMRIGTAIIEISDMPHAPCERFVERYGAKAGKRISRANRLGNRGRGVLATVVEAGDVRVGDPILVLRT